MLTPSQEQGMNPSEWKLTKLRMLNTGEFDPNDWNKLSDYQKYFCNELKKTIRYINAEIKNNERRVEDIAREQKLPDKQLRKGKINRTLRKSLEGREEKT